MQFELEPEPAGRPETPSVSPSATSTAETASTVPTPASTTFRAPTSEPTTCVTCGAPVSEKIQDYCVQHSQRFAGRIYCFKHQRGVHAVKAAD